ncbi:uncharacterized protein [Arachis hypogaea]|uniref:uncharacterized protein n=1 Tax=Arachis hypogaea TaxID=3818 RepID=UPI0010FC5A99|nr:uncharacterized protein LOC114927551 [Arachis hypogaea]
MTQLVEQDIQPPASKIIRIEIDQVNIDILIRDPGKHMQIWNYPISQQDEIRRAYIKFGPYQFIMDEYPLSGLKSHPRRFKAHWFKSFSWLEYSPEVDAVFCLSCYFFSRKSSPFTSGGFRNWKKVNNGKDCAFLSHVDKSLNSPHNITVKSCKDLLNQLCHIDKVLAKQNSQQVLSNRLRLKASIDTIGNAKFCLIVDEVRDKSKREQIALVVRFVDKYGFVKERLIDVHVKDTTSATLKQEICSALSHHNLNIQNVRDQGYDGVALVAAAKEVINVHTFFQSLSNITNLRDGSWGALLNKVNSFCNDHAIQIPDMDASFSDIIRSCRKKDVVIVEHHYRIDIFTSVLDFQLKELNNRFSE